MKKIYQITLLSLSLVIASSCDDGFDELNMSKTSATFIDPIATFNNAIIFSSAPASTLVYEFGAVQQIITPNSGLQVGANFNQVNINSTPGNWTNTYQNLIKYCADVISQTEDDPTRANLYNMARIIQQYGFMILTDTYGDIPYSEAGKGYTDVLFLPKYDSQRDVYNGIISEITAAVAALNAGGRIETSDVLYKGEIVKWKKFGNSILLRAGMRLVNADAAKAAAVVTTALSGDGVIMDNADNAIIRHDANYVNNVGNTVNGTEAANFYLAQPFVDALKGNNDPRLGAIAVRYVGASSGPAQVYSGANANANFSPANQFGVPMGSTDATADAAGAGLPGAGNRYAFSQADRNRVVSRSAPMFIVTAAMNNLLLAEAVERGFAVTGSSADYFAAGITAHMNQMASYGAASTIAAGDITTYVAARTATFLATPAGAALADSRVNEIAYEYWIASFLNGNETWANFRRVGMEQRNYRTPNPAVAAPLFFSNPYSGKVVDWINRITYPPSESLVNTENYNAALQSIGGKDELGSKLFWAQ
jgi:hypothetical protein